MFLVTLTVTLMHAMSNPRPRPLARPGATPGAALGAPFPPSLPPFGPYTCLFGPLLGQHARPAYAFTRAPFNTFRRGCVAMSSGISLCIRTGTSRRGCVAMSSGISLCIHTGTSRRGCVAILTAMSSGIRRPGSVPRGFKGGLFGIHTCCIHYRPSIG